MPNSWRERYPDWCASQRRRCVSPDVIGAFVISISAAMDLTSGPTVSGWAGFTVRYDRESFGSIKVINDGICSGLSCRGPLMSLRASILASVGFIGRPYNCNRRRVGDVYQNWLIPSSKANKTRPSPISRQVASPLCSSRLRLPVSTVWVTTHRTWTTLEATMLRLPTFAETVSR